MCSSAPPLVTGTVVVLHFPSLSSLMTPTPVSVRLGASACLQNSFKLLHLKCTSGVLKLFPVSSTSAKVTTGVWLSLVQHALPLHASNLSPKGFALALGYLCSLSPFPLLPQTSAVSSVPHTQHSPSPPNSHWLF